MIVRSRAPRTLSQGIRRTPRQITRNATTETQPSPPKPSPSEAQRQALLAARIAAREKQAELALAASRADAARQHAVLVERTRKLNTSQGSSDRFIYITAIVLLLATPPTIWFWWQHRAEHMGEKKKAMLEELAERRRVFQEGRGK